MTEAEAARIIRDQAERGRDDGRAADAPSARWSMRPSPATSPSASRPSSPMPSSTRSPRSVNNLVDDRRSRPRRDRRGAGGARQYRPHQAHGRRLRGRLRAAQDRHQCGGREADRHRRPAAGHLAHAEDGDGRNPLGRQRSLSERTTKQAATIEETSAAMEQLATTVLQNAERAKEASDSRRHGDPDRRRGRRR